MISAGIDDFGFTEATDAAAQALSSSGTLSFTDIDTNAVIDVSSAVTTAAVWSGGTIDADLKAALEAGFSISGTDVAAPGSVNWTYSVTDAFDFLDDGETITLTYTVTITDNNNATDTDTVQVTITGTNDAPTLSSVTAGSITEVDQSSDTTDANLSGTLSASDLDDDILTFGIDGGSLSGSTVTQTGTYGTLTLDTSSGAYSFAKNTATIEALNTGESGSDSFTFTVSDGDAALVTQTYTVNVTGAAEAPTISEGEVLYKDQFNSGSNSGWTGDSGDNNDLQINRGGSATKTFNFGTQNSGKSVEITFIARESRFDSTDNFTATANGSQAVANGNFNNQTIQITALIDASGQVQITLENNANQNNEKIKINEIEITAGETLIETTELQNSPVINPISIDLDMDGKIDYLSKEEGQVFYDEGTGIASSIAWVSEHDGLLVIDVDQSGSINEIKEFAFTEWSDSATTDLQALAEVFDTNQDGLLDNRDELYANFGVWQDKNSDAKTDSNELYSLKELGIESIELTYKENSEQGFEAEGEVEVFGQVNVNYADGTVGLAEDTAFSITALSEEQTSWSQSSEDQFIGQPGDSNEVSEAELISEVDDQFSASSLSEVNIATQVEDLLALNYLDINSLEDFADTTESSAQEIESLYSTKMDKVLQCLLVS